MFVTHIRAFNFYADFEEEIQTNLVPLLDDKIVQEDEIRLQYNGLFAILMIISELESEKIAKILYAIRIATESLFRHINNNLVAHNTLSGDIIQINKVVRKIVIFWERLREKAKIIINQWALNKIQVSKEKLELKCVEILLQIVSLTASWITESLLRKIFLERIFKLTSYEKYQLDYLAKRLKVTVGLLYLVFKSII
ncbi:hypothetical protein CDIK_3428 [Cucumispora dikerogammari]|nr:hypothetical protein CDIK_3428 [Cucumispora dikerogammari]